MPLPAVLPDSIGQLSALNGLWAGGNALTGTCSFIPTVLHLTTFCIVDAEEARVKAALPNCEHLYL